MTNNTNTTFTTVDGVEILPPVDSTELMSRFAPEQQWQLTQIWQGIVLSLHLEEQKRQTALAVENQRASNASRFANQDHQNKMVQMQYQADRDDQREAMKAKSAAILAKQTQEHQLAQIQAEHQNNLDLAKVNTQLSIIPKLMEEESKLRDSMLERMEHSHQSRDKVHEMLVEAVIKAKLARKQHELDMEKMQLESSLKRAEQLFQSICLRLSKLLDDSKEEQVKQEIAELLTQWAKDI